MPRVERTPTGERRGVEAAFEISTEILSCAFCGCMDVEGGPFLGNREGTYWIIRCGNPGCSCEMEDSTREELIEQWNRNNTNAVRQYAYKR